MNGSVEDIDIGTWPTEKPPANIPRNAFTLFSFGINSLKSFATNRTSSSFIPINIGFILAGAGFGCRIKILQIATLIACSIAIFCIVSALAAEISNIKLGSPFALWHTDRSTIF